MPAGSTVPTYGTRKYKYGGKRKRKPRARTAVDKFQNQQLRQVQKLLSAQVNKFDDIELTPLAATATAPITKCINVIPEGTGTDTREDITIAIRSIQINFEIEQSTNVGLYPFRLMVVVDRQALSATQSPILGDNRLLTGNSVHALRHWPMMQRYQVLFDNTFQVSSDNSRGNVVGRYYKRFNTPLKVKYRDSTTLVPDYNAIFVYGIAENAAADDNPRLIYEARVTYVG